MHIQLHPDIMASWERKLRTKTCHRRMQQPGLTFGAWPANTASNQQNTSTAERLELDALPAVGALCTNSSPARSGANSCLRLASCPASPMLGLSTWRALCWSSQAPRDTCHGSERGAKMPVSGLEVMISQTCTNYASELRAVHGCE